MFFVHATSLYSLKIRYFLSIISDSNIKVKIKKNELNLIQN